MGERIKVKKFLVVMAVIGTVIFGISTSTHAAEISANNQGEVQELSHWTQFRDGFYKNVLGINRDKDNDRHRDNRHHHKPHHHDRYRR